jgi:hypothetical protein
MLGCVVRGVWDDCIHEGGFSVYGGRPVGGGSVDCNVEVIYFVIRFCFCCERHFGVDCVEVILYVTDVCVVGVIFPNKIFDALLKPLQP